MHALRVLTCVALVGCSGRNGTRPSTAKAEETKPASAPEPPSVTPTATTTDETSADSRFFDPNPDGGAVVLKRPDAPNARYARMDRASCELELARREVPFDRAPVTAGVRAPIRLRGPLHGVAIHTSLTPEARKKSYAEILDCRLALALDDFSALVESRDVVEMIHLSAYRPRWAHGCTKKYMGKQHCAALAIDIASLRKKDGSDLIVDRDFNGRIGLSTCAAGAHPNPSTPLAIELWDLVCESARRALFNVILTPNYNVEHKNHLHLEVTPDAHWMLIR